MTYVYFILLHLHGFIASFHCYHRFCTILLWYRLVVFCVDTIDFHWNVFRVLWSNTDDKSSWVRVTQKICIIFRTGDYSRMTYRRIQLFRIRFDRECFVTFIYQFITSNRFCSRRLPRRKSSFSTMILSLYDIITYYSARILRMDNFF